MVILPVFGKIINFMDFWP